MHARHSNDRIAIDPRAQNRAAHSSHPCRAQAARLCSIFAAMIVTLALAPTALADDLALPNLTVIGVAPDGTETPLTEYRWLVEEDLTYHVLLDGSGAPQSDPNTLSVNFHRSYMPVVAKGCVGFSDLDPTYSSCGELPFTDMGSHYYVSVVPRNGPDGGPGYNPGYSIGGAVYDPSGTTVYVNQHNIPTAQITVLIFEDNFPLNNTPDLPGEDPANPGNTPMDGFQIVVEDAGGRYGASAGVQSLDAFGNPLGTTYDGAGNPNGFGPGQRYASKGCYVVQLGAGPTPELRQVSDWVVQ